MHYWIIFSLLTVIIVKYYTSIEMRKLERRLETVKDDLQRVKEKLQAAQDRQHSVHGEEEMYLERVRRMKEVLEDIQMRMTAKDDAVEEGIVITNSPASASRPF